MSLVRAVSAQLVPTADRLIGLGQQVDGYQVRAARPDTPIRTVGKRRRQARLISIEGFQGVHQFQPVQRPAGPPQPFFQQLGGRESGDLRLNVIGRQRMICASA